MDKPKNADPYVWVRAKVSYWVENITYWVVAASLIGTLVWLMVWFLLSSITCSSEVFGPALKILDLLVCLLFAYLTFQLTYTVLRLSRATYRCFRMRKSRFEALMVMHNAWVDAYEKAKAEGRKTPPRPYQ